MAVMEIKFPKDGLKTQGGRVVLYSDSDGEMQGSFLGLIEICDLRSFLRLEIL